MSEQPAAYNAADPKHIKSRKRKEDREKEKDREALKWVMEHELGRHFVWIIFEISGKFTKDPFTGNSTTDYNCGMQRVGHQLRALIEEHQPKEFAQMWVEKMIQRANDRKTDEAARVKSANGGAEDE